MSDLENIGMKIIYMIRQRILFEDGNYIAAFVGRTGSGKSLSAITMALKIDDNFKIENIVFNPEELMALLNSGKLKKGSCIILDESGVAFGARKWYSETNIQLASILQTFRSLNYALIMCLPSITFLDVVGRTLIHSIITTKRIDRERNVCVVKYKENQTDFSTGKIYKPFPRIKDDDGIEHRLTELEITKPPESVIKMYRVKKDNFVESVLKDAAKSITAEKKRSDSRIEPKENKRQIIEAALKIEPNESTLFLAKKYNVTPRYVNEIKSMNVSTSTSSLAPLLA